MSFSLNNNCILRDWLTNWDSLFWTDSSSLFSSFFSSSMVILVHFVSLEATFCLLLDFLLMLHLLISSHQEWREASFSCPRRACRLQIFSFQETKSCLLRRIYVGFDTNSEVGVISACASPADIHIMTQKGHNVSLWRHPFFVTHDWTNLTLYTWLTYEPSVSSFQIRICSTKIFWQSSLFHCSLNLELSVENKKNHKCSI